MVQFLLSMRRIFHWAGIAFAVPMLGIGLAHLYQYLNGSFGGEVTTSHAMLIVGFIFVSTAAIYLAMRWAGILLDKAIRAFGRIGKGNGTSAGSRPTRPE